MFARTESTNECVIRSLQGLYDRNFEKQGKFQNCLEPFDMTHPFGNNPNLQLVVQVLKVLIFFIAYCFIFLLIA